MIGDYIDQRTIILYNFVVLSLLPSIASRKHDPQGSNGQ